MSCVCLGLHIKAILYVEEPMPHIGLFCATFGGFAILGLAGMFVPLSGQVSPPGVDSVFCTVAFVLQYTAAAHAMYYVTRDPHLKSSTDDMERRHPFFRNCYQHCVASVVTGTVYLMHACFSADRLVTVQRGLDEEAAELAERPAAATSDLPIVDISPEIPITLHLFILDLGMYIYNLKCSRNLRIVCGCKCLQPRQPRPSGPRQRKSSAKKNRLTPHQKASIKATQMKLQQLQNTSVASGSSGSSGRTGSSGSSGRAGSSGSSGRAGSAESDTIFMSSKSTQTVEPPPQTPRAKKSVLYHYLGWK